MSEAKPLVKSKHRHVTAYTEADKKREMRARARTGQQGNLNVNMREGNFSVCVLGCSVVLETLTHI